MKKHIPIYIALLVILSALIVSLFVIFSSAAKTTVPELLGKEGADFTENSYIAQKLDELFALLPYSDYPYFTVMGNSSCGNSSCTSCNGKNVSRMHPMLKNAGVVDDYDSWSCFAFARYACAYIYGTKASGLNYYGNTSSSSNSLRRVGRIASQTVDVSSISGEYADYTLTSLKELLSIATVGDILQVRLRSGSTVGNHTMLFLGCDNDGLYVIHNNSYRTRTDANGKAYGYNRVLISFMSYESLMSTWGSIVTVYRAEEDLYNEAWAKGSNICAIHTFTDKSGDYCEVCRTKFHRPVSTDCVGIYTPTTTVAMHTSPYKSSSTSGNAPTIVTVIAQETNSVGEMWYKTTDGKYIPASSLRNKINDNSVKINMTGYPTGTKKLYNSVVLKGTVMSEEVNIALISGYIINSSGVVMQSQTANPNSGTFDIQTSNINYSLQFARLMLGDYTFIITACDSIGRWSCFKSTFTISTQAVEVQKTKPNPPDPPTKREAGDTYIVLNYDISYEYSRDKKTWQTSNIFIDLTPNTEYTFYQRYAETETTYASDASQPLTVSTISSSKPPQAPSLREPRDSSVGDTWIILENAGQDYEYSRDAVKWQSSPEFTGLTPATNYMFFQRIKGTTVSSAGLLERTNKSTIPKPQPPEIMTFSDSTITIIFYEGFSYGIRKARSEESIKWQDSKSFKGTFENLSPATEYYIYCRIEESEYTFESAPSNPLHCSTDKAFRKDSPDAPVIQTKDSNSVTLVPQKNCEYSINGKEYTTDPCFTNLTPGTVYVFVSRYVETSSTYASEDSQELVVEMLPDHVTSEIYRIDELNKLIVGVPIGTKVDEFLAAFIESKHTAVYNQVGDRLEGDTALATGDRIVINDVSGFNAEYQIIIKSDINRDGKLSLTDLLLMRKYFAGNGDNIDRLSMFACDINVDGKINVIDYALLRDMILNPPQPEEPPETDQEPEQDQEQPPAQE